MRAEIRTLPYKVSLCQYSAVSTPKLVVVVVTHRRCGHRQCCKYSELSALLQ